MSETKTDRPLTPAEARALDALVEWRRAVRRYDAMSVDDRDNHEIGVMLAADEAAINAADAVIAEREVRRG